jgi:hypothetical protein
MQCDCCSCSCVCHYKLENAPKWGHFRFKWNKTMISVPAYLNVVARYKPNAFWDWLTEVKYPNNLYIDFTIEHIGENEAYVRAK